MHSKFLKYGPSDFVCDDDFLRYSLTPTEESEQVWAEWCQQYPHKQQDLEKARQLLEAVQLGLSDYARTYLSKEVEDWLLARIQATSVQAVATKIPIWRSQGMRVMAACIILALGIVGWLYLRGVFVPTGYDQQIAKLSENSIEKVNSGTSRKEFKLPDGSLVWLAPESKLAYSFDFDRDERVVVLLGEATFEVTKNPKRPFLVLANELTTKVLGTRFVVKAYERDKSVTVQVQHGQVSVYQNKTNQLKPFDQDGIHGVLLKTNQQVIFSKQNERFTKTLVGQPLIVPTGEKARISFEFDETPVAEVLERIKTAYQVDIVYDSQVLQGCQLTASLNEENLYRKLDIIAQSIGASYELVDGQIIFASQGCKLP